MSFAVSHGASDDIATDYIASLANSWTSTDACLGAPVSGAFYEADLDGGAWLHIKPAPVGTAASTAAALAAATSRRRRSSVDGVLALRHGTTARLESDTADRRGAALPSLAARREHVESAPVVSDSGSGESAPERGAVSAADGAALPTGLSTVASAPVVIHKEGFLCKRGGTRHSWRKRWFVFTTTQLTYAARATKRPKGAIPLDTIVSVSLCTDKAEVKSRAFCFGVTTPTRTYYIDGESEERRDSWLACLRAFLPHGVVKRFRGTVSESLERIDLVYVSSRFEQRVATLAGPRTRVRVVPPSRAALLGAAAATAVASDGSPTQPTAAASAASAAPAGALVARSVLAPAAAMSAATAPAAGTGSVGRRG